MRTLLYNVWIFDGSPDSGLYRGEVLFDREKILAAGKGHQLTSSAAERVIDGGGLVLSPGFVDVHTHCDASLFSAPEADNAVMQGVTHLVGGNCGLSLFPLTDLNREHISGLFREYELDLNWSDYASFRSELEKRSPRVNVDFLCGHNTLRAAVAGYGKKELSGNEMSAMRRLLETQLRQGAKGLSLGLLYIPGCFAPPEEVKYLLSGVPLAAAHLRSEGKQLLESLTEYISAGSDAQLKYLHVSHLKTAGRENHGKLSDALQMISEGMKNGLSIGFDRYPYIESRTSLSVICPFEADDAVLSDRLRDPAEFGQLCRSLENSGRDWTKVRLAHTLSPRFRHYRGKSIAEIAALENLSPGCAAAAVLREDGTAQGAFAGMNYDNMIEIITSPYCMPGSDEGIFRLSRGTNGEDTGITPAHPRACGTFPEFIRLNLEYGRKLEEVLYRCSTLPASVFGLDNAGFIRPAEETAGENTGAAKLPSHSKGVNLTLFNPDNIGSGADFANPAAEPEGIAAVWSRGEFYPFEI